MTTKIADNKGRISLGAKYANQTMIVEETDKEIRIIPAVVVPASEAWLHQNKRAITAVQRGLKQAATGKLKSKKISANKRLVNQLMDS
jgi:hypothetical protein